MTVENEKINIDGKVLLPNVKKITFGKQDAKILATDNTFSAKDYLLTEGSNDISYRIFDESGVLLEK